MAISPWPRAPTCGIRGRAQNSCLEELVMSRQALGDTSWRREGCSSAWSWAAWAASSALGVELARVEDRHRRRQLRGFGHLDDLDVELLADELGVGVHLVGDDG